jgi:hypothetical protein
MYLLQVTQPLVRWDNDPPGHRTVAPKENSSIPCPPYEVGCQSAAEPQTTPSPLSIIEFSNPLLHHDSSSGTKTIFIEFR